jgi:vacuolar iron transporter family protein
VLRIVVDLAALLMPAFLMGAIFPAMVRGATAAASGRQGWVAGLVAGALSMAAGEYVSVSSQADTEQADLARERGELATSAEAERTELAEIYVARGLSRELAFEVADQLMAQDALGAHARDELGIHELTRARPIQAALASAAAFAVGAAPPALLAAFLPVGSFTLNIVGVTVVLLLALGCSAAVGRLFGAVV